MKKSIFLSCITLLFISCKMLSGSDSHYENFDESRVYKLRLNPAIGSKYYYEVSNESDLNIEVNDKKVNNINKSKAAVYYNISRDSLGNFLFGVQYDKIHIYSKNGDSESDMDADNGTTSINPVDKMLGVLKNANIVTSISPVGEVKNISGYKEMGEQIMASFNTTGSYTNGIAQNQWDKVLEDGFIKKNIEQLFKIFPDSAVHVGEKWKLIAKQDGEIGLSVKTMYKLKAINDGVAIIEAEGDITSDSTDSHLMGYNAMANVKGEQQGEYEVDTKTGMLLNGTVNAKIKGTIQMFGKEIPLLMENKIQMNGRKIK